MTDRVPVTATQGPLRLAPTTARADRKSRGAFFTPQPIADFLAGWAINRDARARVLDPTCGEAVFLQAAGGLLRQLGAEAATLPNQLVGVDVHPGTLSNAGRALRAERLEARFLAHDFFALAPPGEPGATLPFFDAVVGNPPFVRYQEHVGPDRHRAAEAALAQGVRLSGLASSWAAHVVHACAFLKPEGRLAMVLPAELLSVHYAEPVRRWLRRRFAAVHLVTFERLQFEDALENVVLVLAQGTGGCDAFSLYHVQDAADLARIQPFDHVSVIPAEEGKWTDLLLPTHHRQLFRSVIEEHFTSLDSYGSPELGTVTGANHFFAVSEGTKTQYGLTDRHVVQISPPGTRHLQGLSFRKRDWERLRESGEPVWLLHPDEDHVDDALQHYIDHGEAMGVPDAYKCQVRTPWWRPPLTAVPDLFFTYMSHRHPRLVANYAGVHHLNSMHGLRLQTDAPKSTKAALPILALNSVTMLGAEIFGRSYGGGVLKMEPREAATLPVADHEELVSAWHLLKNDRATIDRQLRNGLWTNIVKQVDEALLHQTMGLRRADVVELRQASRLLRQRRIGVH